MGSSAFLAGEDGVASSVFSFLTVVSEAACEAAPACTPLPASAPASSLPTLPLLPAPETAPTAPWTVGVLLADVSALPAVLALPTAASAADGPVSAVADLALHESEDDVSPGFSTNGSGCSLTSSGGIFDMLLEDIARLEVFAFRTQRQFNMGS
jgi:hypothetical protein